MALDTNWISKVGTPLLKLADNDALKGTFVKLSYKEAVPVLLRGSIGEVIDFDLSMGSDQLRKMDLTVTIPCLKGGVPYQMPLVVKFTEVLEIATEKDYLEQPTPVKSVETGEPKPIEAPKEEPKETPKETPKAQDKAVSAPQEGNLGMFGEYLKTDGYDFSTKNLAYLYAQAKILLPSSTVAEMGQGIIAYLKGKGIESITATKVIRKMRKDKVGITL